MYVQVFLKCLLLIVIIAVNDSQIKHCLPPSFFLKLIFSEKTAELKKTKLQYFFCEFYDPFRKQHQL